MNRHSLLPQQVFYHLNYHDRLSGFCSRHIPNIVSACGVWFTFVFRTPTHHAVGSWGRGLTDSRGSFPLGLPCPPLLYPYCITTWEICQGVFYIFFRGWFARPLRTEDATLLRPLPLTLQIIAHLPSDCNRQNAQNWDFYFLDICATFCLTNCWRCVIMEISRPASVGAPLKPRLILN